MPWFFVIALILVSSNAKAIQTHAPSASFINAKEPVASEVKKPNSAEIWKRILGTRNCFLSIKWPRGTLIKKAPVTANARLDDQGRLILVHVNHSDLGGFGYVSTRQYLLQAANLDEKLGTFTLTIAKEHQIEKKSVIGEGFKKSGIEEENVRIEQVPLTGILFDRFDKAPLSMEQRQVTLSCEPKNAS